MYGMKVTLRAARMNKKLKQTEAAALIGVSKYTISNWEKGSTVPDAKDLRIIEKVYGVSFSELIFPFEEAINEIR